MLSKVACEFLIFQQSLKIFSNLKKNAWAYFCTLVYQKAMFGQNMWHYDFKKCLDPYIFNISSVVAFQRWWVLKSKLFAQESTCSNEILIPTSLNHLWFSVVGVLKVDYLDFPCEIFEILCELDVGVIACIF